MLYGCNVAEGDAATGNSLTQRVQDAVCERGGGVVVVSAKLEDEVAQLGDSAQQKEFLKEYGLNETGQLALTKLNASGLSAIVRETSALLHLSVFYTVGPQGDLSCPD